MHATVFTLTEILAKEKGIQLNQQKQLSIFKTITSNPRYHTIIPANTTGTSKYFFLHSPTIQTSTATHPYTKVTKVIRKLLTQLSTRHEKIWIGVEFLQRNCRSLKEKAYELDSLLNNYNDASSRRLIIFLFVIKIQRIQNFNHRNKNSQRNHHDFNKVVICGDFNAHHSMWSAGKEDHIGKHLGSEITYTNLIILKKIYPPYPLILSTKQSGLCWEMH
ncbi:hypothetical protein TSAR_012705 [Trichomalopsis sarcophagae]|uniref:Endonuclease/exonuclease/phosphatase domain-containing protein n=1 Tax=Trichomalopsis sarcophagae TaxID=543379 RepID=A0A232EEU5_9HYME|nr:hypothetical protein TSAR_012705 [Trichomalopsis sarcophagae]